MTCAVQTARKPALYVGGGAGFVYQTQGVVGLPHKERWGQLAGLVVDGSSFALGGFKKADGFEKIPESLAGHEAEDASPPQVGGGGQAGGGEGEEEEEDEEEERGKKKRAKKSSSKEGKARASKKSKRKRGSDDEDEDDE